MLMAKPAHSGFPFGVDSLPAPDFPASSKPNIADVYDALSKLMPEILQAQQEKRTRGLVLHASSPRATQTVSLGGYLLQATLSRSWPARNLLTDDGAMMVLQIRANAFTFWGAARL